MLLFEPTVLLFEHHDCHTHPHYRAPYMTYVEGSTRPIYMYRPRTYVIPGPCTLFTGGECLRKDNDDLMLDKDDIIDILNKYAKQCVVQLEAGDLNGTLHYQGIPEYGRSCDYSEQVTTIAYCSLQ